MRQLFKILLNALKVYLKMPFYLGVLDAVEPVNKPCKNGGALAHNFCAHFLDFGSHLLGSDVEDFPARSLLPTVALIAPITFFSSLTLRSACAFFSSVAVVPVSAGFSCWTDWTSFSGSTLFTALAG